MKHLQCGLRQDDHRDLPPLGKEMGGNFNCLFRGNNINSVIIHRLWRR